MPKRNVTLAETARSDESTPTEQQLQERFRLYRLCPCDVCDGTGKPVLYAPKDGERCHECRGEGKVRELVAACPTEQDVGVALVTLGREGEFAECPFGLLDTLGEVGQKWLVSPWLPSARNVSDAGRVLAKAPRKGEK